LPIKQPNKKKKKKNTTRFTALSASPQNWYLTLLNTAIFSVYATSSNWV
jgi:hypothetical protein